MVTMQDFNKTLGLSMIHSIGLSDELIASINKRQEQMKSFCAPIQNMQKQINLMTSPLRESIERFNEVSATYNDFYNRMNECFRPLREFAISYNLQIQDSIQRQSKILESLSENNFDTPLSSESSKEFSEISVDIVNELNDSNMVQFQDAPMETETVLSNQTNKLTWQEVFMIIGFIISVLSFIQSSLPDKQISNIEKHFEQLIDIQNKELELMQKSPE